MFCSGNLVVGQDAIGEQVVGRRATRWLDYRAVNQDSRVGQSGYSDQTNGLRDERKCVDVPWSAAEEESLASEGSVVDREYGRSATPGRGFRPVGSSPTWLGTDGVLTPSKQRTHATCFIRASGLSCRAFHAWRDGGQSSQLVGECEPRAGRQRLGEHGIAGRGGSSSRAKSVLRSRQAFASMKPWTWT